MTNIINKILTTVFVEESCIKYNPTTRLTLKALISNIIPAWLKSPSQVYCQQRGWKQHEYWLAPGPDVVWWQMEMEQENHLDKTQREPSLHETV